MKRIISLFLLFTILVLSLFGCDKKNNNLKKVKLNEVAHSIFYAPQYAAYELGYFKDEGIDLEIITGFGADKTMTAVLSGEADIGFMGSEASIYVAAEEAEELVVNFAQLTQRAGNFLVAREPMSDFSWDEIKGKTVLGGRQGGMPQMVFEYILKKNNIDPAKDLNIVQNIDFGSTAAAFTGGKGDFTVEFEPFATALEEEEEGFVVASLGVDSGYVPYTAYCAKESYLDKNDDIIQSFTNALQKGMDYVNSHSAMEIAETIKPQFSETDTKTIANIIERYKTQNTWKENLIFEKNSFTLLCDILRESGQLEKEISYEKLVTTKFAKKATK